MINLEDLKKEFLEIKNIEEYEAAGGKDYFWPLADDVESVIHYSDIFSAEDVKKGDL